MTSAMPWLKDCAAALLLIAFCVGSFAGMGWAADALSQAGWLAPFHH